MPDDCKAAIIREPARHSAKVTRLNSRAQRRPQLEDSRELRILLGACLAETRAQDQRDLTQRQMAVLLTVYLDDGPHTVRGMAAHLGVSKPVVTRALDRLGHFDLARRKVDMADRRSVLVVRTPQGAAFLRRLDGALDAAAVAADAALAERRAKAG